MEGRLCGLRDRHDGVFHADVAAERHDRKQRKGIADYFNPTIPINRISGGGEGSFGGTNIFAEQVLAQNGTGASLDRPSEEHAARGNSGSADTADDASGRAEAALREIDEMLTGRGGESMVSERLLRHIVTRVTDEGLIVELFDTQDAAMFASGSAVPTALGEALAALLAEIFAIAQNEVAVEGHVRALPVVTAGSDAWTLSSQRAQQMRRCSKRPGWPHLA
jgi:chemotaxis protein MotB